MKPNTELKVLNLCKGLTIAQATYRLDMLEKYCRQRELTLRIRTVNITIGE